MFGQINLHILISHWAIFWSDQLLILSENKQSNELIQEEKIDHFLQEEFRVHTSTRAAFEGSKRLFLTAFTPTAATILLISQIIVKLLSYSAPLLRSNYKNKLDINESNEKLVLVAANSTHLPLRFMTFYSFFSSCGQIFKIWNEQTKLKLKFN